ncbi:GFA family protein [Bradyrhizobium algeriense]|uniref:GFA family protein n=1 Tax=Bradyrhizobium algeriense TaxID=634784 RepID=UPI0011AE9EA6
MPDRHEGGCLCDAIRYRIHSIFDVVYCHCAKCRRRCGAPVSLSVVVPKGEFELIKGAPASFRSSGVGANHFCSICGTQLYFVEDRGPYVSVSHGSLDEPESVRPRAHQWLGSALSWFHIDDGLPSFADGHLTHPDRRSELR